MPKYQNPRHFSVFISLFKIIAPHKRWIAFCILLSFATTTFSLLLTFFTQQLITRTVDEELLPSTVWFFLILVLASALSVGLSGIASGRLGAYTGRDLKRSVSTKVMKADFRTIQNISSGDAISIMNSDCKQISAFLTSDLFSLATQLLTAVCAFGYLFFLNPILAVICFAYTPIGMIIASKINRRMNSLYPVLSEQKGKALTGVEQALVSLPVIKSFNMERKMLNKLDIIFKHIYKTDKQVKQINKLSSGNHFSNLHA